MSQLLRYRNGSLTFKDNLSVVTKSEPVTPEVILKQSILYWIRLHPIKTQQLGRVCIVCSLPGHVIVAAHTISLRQQKIHVTNILPRKRQVRKQNVEP
jgi:hypothetical protein